MNVIESFLKGEIGADIFALMLEQDDELKSQIRNLVPMDARDNPNHCLWTIIGYNGLKPDNFDCLTHIKRICRFDNSLGDNLNMFSIIEHVYCAFHPDVHCTTYYHEMYELYLDAVQDCFEGPEVSSLVNELLKSLIEVMPKSKRRKDAKELVKTTFHVVDNKRPHWIQGPEWPMGKKSPMKFQKRVKKGEEIKFYFEDVDNGEIRIVTQYY